MSWQHGPSLTLHQLRHLCELIYQNKVVLSGASELQTQRSLLGAKADERTWDREEWDLCPGGGKSPAWLSWMWKGRWVLCYKVICTRVIASTSSGSVCLSETLLLRSIPDVGIDLHGSNQCVIFQ